MQSEKQEIWVLGSKGHGADKEIDWLDEFPNFVDFDILIVNAASLESLDQMLSAKEFDAFINKLKDASKKIVERINSETPSKLFILLTKIFYITDKPPSDDTNEIAPFQVGLGKRYWIDEFILKSLDLKIYGLEKPVKILKIADDANSYINCEKSKYYIYCKGSKTGNSIYIKDYMLLDILAKDKADKILAARLNIKECYVYILPIEEGKEKESIDELIRQLKPSYPEQSSYPEQPPQWVKNIRIQGIDDLSKEIEKIKEDITRLTNEMNSLQKKKEEFEEYYRLLWSSGDMLEDIVERSLKLLGFDNVEKHPRGNDKEDLKLKFNNTNYPQAIIEVKGFDNDMNLKAIRQIIDWILEYEDQLKVEPKGVIIYNQHRKDEYPESRERRIELADNIIKRAESMKICLIPSHVLFEAVRRVLNGKEPNRAKLEELIADTNGILSSLDEAFTS